MQIQLNHNNKVNSPIQKWTKDLNRHFSREVTEIAKKHMKRCSASLVTGETQIKTTERHHLTPIGLAKFFFLILMKRTSVGKGVEKLKSLCIAGGNEKQCKCIYQGKQFCTSSKS